MRTEVDLTKLTPYQREVLTALVRPLSKNDVVRLLQIVRHVRLGGHVLDFDFSARDGLAFRQESAGESRAGHDGSRLV